MLGFLLPQSAAPRGETSVTYSCRVHRSAMVSYGHRNFEKTKPHMHRQRCLTPSSSSPLAHACSITAPLVRDRHGLPSTTFTSTGAIVAASSSFFPTCTCMHGCTCPRRQASLHGSSGHGKLALIYTNYLGLTTGPIETFQL